jgi:7,8-dihydro-6-hydroxymethylpterin dimethyltransferase
VEHDLDRLGIAKTAREEKICVRDARMKEQQENERMAKPYRQHVLKEQGGPERVQIGGAPPAPVAAPAAEEREEVGSFGD